MFRMLKVIKLFTVSILNIEWWWLWCKTMVMITKIDITTSTTTTTTSATTVVLQVVAPVVVVVMVVVPPP